MIAAHFKCLGIAMLANVTLITFAVLRGITKSGKPGLYFGEGRFTTFFSCLQLLMVALLSLAIFRMRGLSEKQEPWDFQRALWLLVGCGFIFLAVDDAFQIHENAARWIHSAL